VIDADVVQANEAVEAGRDFETLGLKAKLVEGGAVKFMGAKPAFGRRGNLDLTR
jgi:hypothetical protein